MPQVDIDKLEAALSAPAWQADLGVIHDAAALKSAKQMASNECWPMEELEIENALAALQPFLGETK